VFFSFRTLFAARLRSLVPLLCCDPKDLSNYLVPSRLVSSRVSKSPAAASAAAAALDPEHEQSAARLSFKLTYSFALSLDVLFSRRYRALSRSVAFVLAITFCFRFYPFQFEPVYRRFTVRVCFLPFARFTFICICLTYTIRSCFCLPVSLALFLSFSLSLSFSHCIRRPWLTLRSHLSLNAIFGELRLFVCCLALSYRRLSLDLLLFLHYLIPLLSLTGAKLSLSYANSINYRLIAI
jgi:hypothetical protein